MLSPEPRRWARQATVKPAATASGSFPGCLGPLRLEAGVLEVRPGQLRASGATADRRKPREERRDEAAVPQRVGSSKPAVQVLRAGAQVVPVQMSHPEVVDTEQHAPLVACVLDAPQAQLTPLASPDDISRPERDLESTPSQPPSGDALR